MDSELQVLGERLVELLIIILVLCDLTEHLDGLLGQVLLKKITKNRNLADSSKFTLTMAATCQSVSVPSG